MDTPRDVFHSQQYNINRVLLSLLGQWPFQKARHRRAILITVSLIGLTQALAQVLALITLRDDPDAIIECIPPLIIDGACLVKLVNLIINMKKFKILFMHMQRDWQSWTIRSELEILHKFAESGRSITIGYADSCQGHHPEYPLKVLISACCLLKSYIMLLKAMSLMIYLKIIDIGRGSLLLQYLPIKIILSFIISGMYAFGSLFPLMAMVPKIIGTNVISNYTTRPVGFPYHVEYYVDLNKYYYYYPALIHNYLTTCIRLTTIVASDACIAILVQHCCGLFSVVRFANCLETVYTKALFLEVGLVILAMSSSALQATSQNLNVHLAIRHGGYIVAQLLHLYLASWLGQQVIDHSDSVYTSIYKGDWYESSPRCMKLLNMMMLRSSSPCTITIGKLMVLSLPTFSAVVRVSASYFTVMQSVQ